MLILCRLFVLADASSSWSFPSSVGRAMCSTRRHDRTEASVSQSATFAASALAPHPVGTAAALPYTITVSWLEVRLPMSKWPLVPSHHPVFRCSEILLALSLTPLTSTVP